MPATIAIVGHPNQTMIAQLCGPLANQSKNQIKAEMHTINYLSLMFSIYPKIKYAIF
jgi:hypothetical protein